MLKLNTKEVIKGIKPSFLLDIALLRTSSLDFKAKLELLLKKYYVSLKHVFIPFKLGESKIHIFGEDLYYSSKEGLFFYQSILITCEKLFRRIKGDKISTVVDVGANVGYFSKAIHKFFPQAYIYAIEPIPQAHSCLEKNFRNNNSLQSYQFALFDKAGEIAMYVPHEDVARSFVSNKGKLTVSAITLDKFILDNKISRVDMLKIDAERSEAHVLRGGTKTLGITKYLLLEVALVHHKNYTFSSLIKLLSSKNYNFQLIGIKNYTEDMNNLALIDCLFKNILIK